MYLSHNTRNVVTWITVVLLCIGAYSAVFVPCVERYPGVRVVKSAFCTSHFYDCDKRCFYDIDDVFCLIVSNNCSFAVRNTTHVQIGSYIYYRSLITPTNSTITGAESIASKAQRC